MFLFVLLGIFRELARRSLVLLDSFLLLRSKAFFKGSFYDPLHSLTAVDNTPIGQDSLGVSREVGVLLVLLSVVHVNLQRLILRGGLRRPALIRYGRHLHNIWAVLLFWLHDLDLTVEVHALVLSELTFALLAI